MELKAEDRNLLKSAIKAFEASKQQPPEPKSDEGGSQHHEGHSSLGDLVDCPNCYPQVKDAVFKKELPNLRNPKYECEDCGLPVALESDNCPWCGGKNAKEK